MNKDQTLPISLDKLKECDSITCECGSQLWNTLTIAKKVPGILIGASGTAVVNVGVLCCALCLEVERSQRDMIQDTKEKILPN